MADKQEKPRWQYRYDNFQRAVMLLREALETLDTGKMSQLEREGMIQRFEFCWELAWKTLKDYLDHQGITLPTATPRSVIRAAHMAGILSDGEAWMAALDARNKMSHTYNFKAFEQVVVEIQTRYMALIESLFDFLTDALLTDVAK